MKTWTRLLFGATALTSVAIAAPALAAGLDEPVAFNIAPGSLDEALIAYSQQADLQVISASAAVCGKRTEGVEGATTPREALAMLLQDSGLSFVATSPSTVTVTQGEQAGGGDSAGATVEALIVTAQKREENIQDVPIAISAFSAKALDELKIEGGFDLLKAIPNVTFSKNNFSSFNFSIRGIGTKAVSATTDPGVAVAFNNTTIIQNRLFEQEYFDVERVEVLRGPQGTLYGRNATSGVINVISAKPDLSEFDGWVKGEVGNYHTKRVSAMVNVPLIDGKLAIRFAGALTDRQGYDFNEGTGHAVNGRDLWSGRISLGFEPMERLRGNLIWERFNEDDNRSRTGKQLCHRDDGPITIGSYVFPNPDSISGRLDRALFTPGCKAGSLYDEAAFGTPNGLALPFVFGMLIIGSGPGSFYPIGRTANGDKVTLIDTIDPYAGLTQSRDLRVINSILDPVYRARADLVELNVDFDVSPDLTLTSQTAYVKDSVYSFQDFNRFNTQPIFNDTTDIYDEFSVLLHLQDPANPLLPTPWSDSLAPGGVFCDPQIGCSNRMAGFDISQAKATQFSQELRLQSDFDGPVNFSVGANYTRFKTLIDYYVMYNLITAFARIPPFNFQGDPTMCFNIGTPGVVEIDHPQATCPYIDPNPVESINGEGHNYFRSKNPYKLSSSSIFGELYWEAREDLKVTAGLRYTDDNKTFTPVPTQVLLAPFFGGGVVNRGYPEEPDIKQHWGEMTGRLGVDWKPDLTFTDDTMLYAFFSRGYKGGGANPPVPDFATVEEASEQVGFPLPQPWLELTANYETTFRPEFVNAFEVGAKNTLLGGGLVFNATAFFYDYTDYQVSQIRERTAVNENFDAKVWGLEFETVFRPSRDLNIIANLGYLDTEIGKGMKSLDTMNRTQSDPYYMVVKPWAQLPSNCVLPLHVVEYYALNATQNVTNEFYGLCGGWHLFPDPFIYDPLFDGRYDPANYPALNGGIGLLDDLSGNELPNSPHWTMNIGTQYGFDFLEDWRVTLRGDAYWQSQSWARIYNAVNDKLHGWYNVNLSIWFERPDDDLKIELYAKNLLDKTPITDAFLNSDDTALTTNVFVLDPRLIGLSIKKGF